MKNLWRCALIVAFASSCASLSEKDCKTGNWSEIGKRDGERGMSEGRLESHQKACSEYGVTVDAGQYFNGRSQGIVTYCHKTGEAHGVAGQMNNTPTVCTGSKEYTTSRKVGYGQFCYNKGVEGGKAANTKHAPDTCKPLAKYKEGWNVGIKAYCTKENAEILGKQGSGHLGSLCPSSLRSNFLSYYDKGIATYCTKANGFNFGKNGNDINTKVCPSKYRNNFSFGYKKGLEYKNIKKQILDIDTKISELQTKIDDPATSTDLRSYLQKEVTENNERRSLLEKETYRIEGAVGV
jgi:hypothetical protein